LVVEKLSVPVLVRFQNIPIRFSIPVVLLKKKNLKLKIVIIISILNNTIYLTRLRDTDKRTRAHDKNEKN
jgi:hypothetical protein